MYGVCHKVTTRGAMLPSNQASSLNKGFPSCPSAVFLELTGGRHEPQDGWSCDYNRCRTPALA